MKLGSHKVFDGRMIAIQVLVFLWMAVICGRLVYLQIGQHEWLSARAGRQHQFEIPLSPKRGVILDRNNSELARSVEVKSLYASPAEIKDKNPEAIAEKLARALDIDKEDLARRLTSTNLAAVAVKLKLSDDEVARVEALDLPGLHFVKEMKRFYVGGQTATHIVGFVNSEEVGKGGIELAYEKMIGGQGGRLLLDVDALKKSYGHEIEESAPGANVRLTIDVMIQHYVEKALADAVRTSRARGGTIVITRPSTGEILALASYPTFDPNKVSESSEDQRRNRAVEVAFEPGSIFKIVPYSAAIEEGIIRPDTLIDCGGGQIRIADRIVRDGRYGV
ncbi:MAG TPA: penicillin-binding transpeptidase domain-containing protein, partial [Blastocatellia bacterium]|nr:penicillin-binding transpeptidase domain-containing protein [Blastocatellia bacterium]